MRVRLIIFLSALLAVPSAALADTTYTYTGNPFTSFGTGTNNPYTASDSVSGSFTLATPLGANYNGNLTIDPTGFSFSDGINTITIQNVNAGLFGHDTLRVFSTDANGVVTGWDIELAGQPALDGTEPYIATWGYITPPAGVFLTPADLGRQADSLLIAGFNNNDSGTWIMSSNSTHVGSASVTPEPSSVLLLGTGLLGAFGAARRKLRS